MSAKPDILNWLFHIGRFAIGGGIAHFYYIEAGTTYDLDVMVTMNAQASTIFSLEPLYEWAKKSGYIVSEEHIIIEGIPVQFLPSFNATITEAIEQADLVEIFGVKTFIMKPEYLMVIMLDTYIREERERSIKFFTARRIFHNNILLFFMNAHLLHLTFHYQ